MISSNIFRSYDIRGIYPAELNKETAYLIGQAFVKYIGAKKIVVGHDMRLSSPDLLESMCRGIVDSGCSADNIGEIPTEVLYFSVGHHKYDGGIMITASHNPKEYNGFKFIKKDRKGFLMIRGKDLYDSVRKGDFTITKKKGKIKELDARQGYIGYIFSLFNVKKIKPFKIVIDAGNGMAARIIPLLEKKLPIQIIPLNFKIDGSFPSHPSNPLEEGVTNQIREAIKKEKADFGFIFDGDSDRIFLIDEQGNLIKGDATFLLMARYFLEKNPGAGFSYNAICSKAVPELINKWGGKAFRTPVGFVNVQESLIKNNGIMGGELSGHYCFKDNFYGDSAFMAFLALLNIISESGKPISGMIAEVSLYAKASEINFKIENKEAVINKIKEKYSDGKQDYLDGVTVEYKDWWFNIRPSNTEPILRLTIEAKTKDLLEEKKRELNSFILNNQ